MAQESATFRTPKSTEKEVPNTGRHTLGPLLCWAVVFADIGTSVYYTPGILYGTVGKLAGFFIFLTMIVFVLLTLKYSEVTQRFPQGGGVVTVAAQAMNHWVGALGGMFILVDYFLTAALSCLSGILYLSVVVPGIGPPFALWIAVGMLVLLGILNWFGISESAKVSLVGAIIAFGSDIAILVMVFTHISFLDFLGLFPRMFANESLTPLRLLTGFAGSFLAFSGLESISQLSPVMRTPRKKVSSLALFLVVITIGITSPILTMLSTLLQPAYAKDVTYSAQLISLLGGHWGSIILQTEVAISASALLVFASNTAIIGSYHVFIALSRMEFFPTFILKRNRLRGTPHYSIALATGIPIAILIVANGSLDLLGNLYAFGLLGAFTLTCLGLDIVRHRERRYAARHSQESASQTKGFWKNIDFWLGILTTVLVALAWSTNLVAKPAATAFGGSVAIVGMLIALFNYRRHTRQGRAPIGLTNIEHYLPGSTLAVLLPNDTANDAVIHTAIAQADGKPVVFLYVSKPTEREQPPSMFEFTEPYLQDTQAKNTFARTEYLAQKAKIDRRYIYRQDRPGLINAIWQIIHPRDTIIGAPDVPEVHNISPDTIRYDLTPEGKVAHLLKRW